MAMCVVVIVCVIMPAGTVVMIMVVTVIMSAFFNLETDGKQVEQAKNHHGNTTDQCGDGEETPEQIMRDSHLIKVKKYASPRDQKERTCNLEQELY